MAVTFDTLKASRRLQEAGFDEAKAEAIVSIFAGDIGASLATKRDLTAMRTDLKREITAVRAEMAQMEQRLEHRLTIRMGAMVAGGRRHSPSRDKYCHRDHPGSALASGAEFAARDEYEQRLQHARYAPRAGRRWVFVRRR